MATRLEDVPVIKVKPSTIEAEIYNRIRLGLIRLENPLRLTLPGLRGMDVLLDDKAWVCVDRTLYDLPVLAWTDFQTQSRAGLHAPIECRVNYYHIHANVIAETVLATTDRLLKERLKPYQRAEAPLVAQLSVAGKR